MGISVVSICNQALSKFGAGPILSLTEDTDAARACNRVYEQCRNKLLSRHPWNFSINRATLAMLADAPAYGYDHAYQLPTNPYCLRVLEMYEERQNGADWLIEGRKLVTNSDTARIKYISMVTDPTEFSAGFVNTLIPLIAAEVAIPVTGESGNAKTMIELYQAEYLDAIGDDTAEGYADEDVTPIEKTGSWLSER